MWTALTPLWAQEVSWDRRYPWLMLSLGVALAALTLRYALRRKVKWHDDDPDGTP